MKIHPPQHSPMSDTKLSFFNTQVYRVQNKVLLRKERHTQVYLKYNESLSKRKLDDKSKAYRYKAKNTSTEFMESEAK